MATLCHSLDPKAFTNHYVLLRCAEDTYFGFTGNLRYALGEAEFLDWDHEEIERKAIAESSICIVILSPRFLSSPSCLDELVQIVEEFGKGRMGQLLLPVLYDLESSLVQQLIYNHKITVHPHKFDNWLQALTQVFTVAAHFTACHFQSDGDRYEYECIMKIVQQVSKHVASTLGLNLQEKEVIQLLNSGPDDGVHVIGIFGDPAIGKKIARTAYNLFAGEGFDSYCFLNVGENLSGPRFGHFLHMFCSRIVCNNCGISIMSTPKSTLNQMKVFVVFHDINDPDLLKYAVELTNWFGSGSRVIVTSDHKCLFESHGVKRVYQVEMSDRTTVRYENVIDRAEACVSGHPLPLEVIDSNSPGKIIEEFKSALDQCERTSNTDLLMQNMIGEIKEILFSRDIPEENEVLENDGTNEYALVQHALSDEYEKHELVFRMYNYNLETSFQNVCNMQK